MNNKFNNYINSIKKIKVFNNTSVSYLNAMDLASMYKIQKPTFTKKVNVAIISFGGGVYGNITSSGQLTNSDCHKYWRSLNINNSDMPTVNIKQLLGALNTPNESNDSLNNAITIQQIGACCPSSNLNIILYIVPNDINNLPNVLNTILNESLSVIVIPWGAPENNISSELMNNINTIFESASNKGINIITGVNNTCNFPASSPNVVACGRSKLINNKEEACNNYNCSNIFSKPNYQCNLNGTNRITPDISLNSSNVMYILNSNKYIVDGPTIAISTMTGFILASNINKFINNSIYWSSDCFNKLSNSLGSIIGDKLANYINNYIPVISINFDKPSLSLQLPVNTKSIRNIHKNTQINTFQLVSIVLPSNATNNKITWSSSNNNVATVTSTGLLTLITKGTITITISLNENNLNKKCIINII